MSTMTSQNKNIGLARLNYLLDIHHLHLKSIRFRLNKSVRLGLFQSIHKNVNVGSPENNAFTFQIISR